MRSRTVFTVLEKTADSQRSAIALSQPVHGKDAARYTTYSWEDYRRIAAEIACGLTAFGIGRGDVVAIQSETRAEFYLADMGVMANGSIAAALYTSYPMPEMVRNLRQAGARAVILETAKQFRAVKAACGDFDARWILLTGEAEGAVTLEALRAAGRDALAADPQYFERIRGQVSAGDPAILYLTSGATGEPKMGLVTHGAIVANLDTGPKVLPTGPDDRTLAFLPSAHIAQRIVMQLLPIRHGMPVTFSESLARLPHELRSVRPTFFLAPPRVWERIYSSICTEIRKLPAVKQKMFHGALGLSLLAGKYRAQGRSVPAWMRAALKLADKAVFAKIRERFGGALRIAVSGAAPLGRDLALFYEAVGMPLIEGYGLTEGGVATLNPVDQPRYGSIGKPLDGVELKLAEDGELALRSPALFSGYFNDPAATAQVLRDGWLYTGDIATIDNEGYVYITGRKKELLVSSNGKKIYPSRVEALFKSEPLISQVVLVGDRLPFVSALITVNAAAAETFSGPGEVEAEVKKAVTKANQELADYERIRKFKVLDRDFSLEQGELTPTMKVRRTKVLENFRDTIGELYAGKEESH